MEKGLDITEGGARFNIGPGWVMVGIADCANSIAPIKRLVYDDRKISMSELCEALKNDFDGYEQIHQMLLNFPKYGNDDDFVDQFQVELTDFAAREIKKYKDTLGLPFHTAIMGMTVNIPSGNVLGALPSGRKERVPLAEGTSPHPGTDISGPTAAMKSVAKVNHENHPGGTLLNLKFLPKAVEGEKGISALSALIRGYFDLGGYHCQFNVIDPQTLRDAQEYPEKHQDLIVRVAGYSSRFVILSKDVQDEIIRRTSHKAI
jgi:formate C-acetyltransferase